MQLSHPGSFVIISEPLPWIYVAYVLMAGAFVLELSLLGLQYQLVFNWYHRFSMLDLHAIVSLWQQTLAAIIFSHCCSFCSTAAHYCDWSLIPRTGSNAGESGYVFCSLAPPTIFGSAHAQPYAHICLHTEKEKTPPEVIKNVKRQYQVMLQDFTRIGQHIFIDYMWWTNT